MAEIEITIAPDGSVQYQTRGFKGTSCKEFTKSFQKALAGKIASDKATPEAFEESVKATQVQKGFA